MKNYLITYYKKGGYHTERVKAPHLVEAIEIVISHFGLSDSQIFSAVQIPDSY